MHLSCANNYIVLPGCSSSFGQVRAFLLCLLNKKINNKTKNVIIIMDSTITAATAKHNCNKSWASTDPSSLGSGKRDDEKAVEISAFRKVKCLYYICSIYKINYQMII